MMQVFSPGDRVIYTGNLTEELVGKTGTVTAFIAYDEVEVDWDYTDEYTAGVMGENLTLLPSPMQIVNDYHEAKQVPVKDPIAAFDYLMEKGGFSSDPFKEQVGGSHYKTLKIQPVEFILANQLGFCEGSIIKYTCRYRQKGGIEDLKKVIHYAQLLIAKLEEGNNA